MSREVIIGGEGKFTFNGTDWEVTDINATEETTEQPTTCTSNWDDTDKMVYQDEVVTSRRLSGDFTVELDRNNLAYGAIRAGDRKAFTLQLYSGKTITGTALIGNIGLRMGGPMGIWGATVPFKTVGKYTIN